MTAQTKKTIKKVADIVGNILIWAFVALSILITVLVFASLGSQDGVPEVFGKSWLTIQSPSMDPTYKTGDLIFMTKLRTTDEKKTLQAGDIITYHAPIDINGDGEDGDINTHRIVSHDPATGIFITRGDNNLADDNYTIGYNDIIGVCTEKAKIRGVGNVIAFMQSSLGFFLCILLPLILFFIYELYHFISVVLSERAKSKPVSKETEEEIKRRAIEEYLKAQAEQQAAAQPTENNENNEEK